MDSSSSSYDYVVYRHTESRQYRPGEAVYVWLKSQYSTGRAVVLATPDTVPADSAYSGRYLVRFTSCGSTAHVRPERLLPVYQQQQQQPRSQHQHQQQQQQQQSQQQQQQQQEDDLWHAVQQLTVSADPQHAAADNSTHNDHQQQHHHHQQHQHQQHQQAGLVLLVADTVDYRRLARSQVQAGDGVLELGCSYGVCSRMLQEHGAWLLGVDNSEVCVRQARKHSPGGSFHQVDVLEQQDHLLQLAGCCSCRNSSSSSSSSSSSATAAPANGHLSSNGSCGSGPADSEGAGAPTVSSCSGCCAAGAVGGGAAVAVGACACACVLQPRSPPCNVVFADIGGNRQLESLVKLVPWVLQAIRPRLLVVKSEELVAAAEQQLAAEATQQQPPPPQQQEQQQGPAGEQQQQQQQQGATAAVHGGDTATASAAAVLLAEQLGVSSLTECDAVIRDVPSWWEQLQQQCGNPASQAEPWFVAARAAGFSRNPMRYPQRCTADGSRICRPHNYDRQRGCLKSDGCQFDHAHCHHCLQPGHRAVDCPVMT